MHVTRYCTCLNTVSVHIKPCDPVVCIDDNALFVQVRLLLLAGLASEHLLLLGPPGTAKSELSRRLSNLTSGRYYERLLTRFSVPEELFGPLSMRGTPLLYVLQADLSKEQAKHPDLAQQTCNRFATDLHQLHCSLNNSIHV